jgi:hypothetical protein
MSWDINEILPCPRMSISIDVIDVVLAIMQQLRVPYMSGPYGVSPKRRRQLLHRAHSRLFGIDPSAAANRHGFRYGI